MKGILTLAAIIVTTPMVAFSATTVIEAAAAKPLYDAQKATSQVIVQKDKVFLLRAPGAADAPVETLTVKVGEKFFLTNEEEKYVHNVYDTSDSSWVLKKQEPAEVAAISFDAPGVHALRCAIHPKMKLDVTVK